MVTAKVKVRARVMVRVMWLLPRNSAQGVIIYKEVNL
jgi:hypothetical protein